MRTALFKTLMLAALTVGSAFAQGEHDERGSAGSQPFRGLFYYVIQDLTADRIVARGTQVTGGDIHQGQLLPARHRFREGILHASTLKFGFSEFVTPDAGQSFEFPRTTFQDASELLPDADRDGLADVVEFIVGSDPAKADSDNDGISDGAEVRAGESPVAPTENRLGVVAAADTPGNAIDVAAAEGRIAVADDGGGLAVFQANPPGNPILLRRFTTNGAVRSVSISEGRILATTTDGLLVVGLRTAELPGSAVFINAPGARCATGSGDTAFVGTGDGRILRVDLVARSVVGSLSIGSRVDDLAERNGIIYAAVGGSTLRTFRVLPEAITPLASAPLSFGLADGFTGRHRVSLGVDEAFVTSYPGFDRFSVSNPASITRIGNARDVRPNSFKQIIPTGSGLGVAVSGVVPRDDGTHDVWLYDLSAPEITTNLVAVLTTPGIAQAVALYNGLAYVADGSSGLQVVNYLEADRAGLAPTISLQTSFPLTTATNGIAEAGASATVVALVTDDVAVRAVRFFVNGELVSTDGNFPFEHRFNMPNSASETVTVQAIALDGGGNAGTSALIEVEIVPDATPPLFVRGFPRAGELIPEFISATATFSESIELATINDQNVKLRFAGVNGTFGNADDVVIEGTEFAYDQETFTLRVRSSSRLGFGLYRLEISTGLRDFAGIPLENAASIEFRVVDLLTDADGDGLSNDLELLIGLDPAQPDTNGNGTPDGREDNDRDGLANMDEARFGFNPLFLDTDGNGVSDGEEDQDGDTLSVRRELEAGTNPLLPDTDGDGWPDEGELTGGSNPLLATSQPFLPVIGLPTTEVIAPRAVFAGGQLGVTVALPVVEVLAPRAVFTGAEPGVTVALPVVEVIAPRAVLTDTLTLGTTVALPVVEVIAPRESAAGEPLELGPVLAQPLVEVIFGP